jgi:hypothetical protein
VDATATADGEKNPYGEGDGAGVQYLGGKTLMRYVFVKNASGQHGTEGYWQGTSDETTVRLRGYKTLAKARTAADGAVAGKLDNQTVTNHVSRHGRWWVLETHVQTHHNG